MIRRAIPGIAGCKTESRARTSAEARPPPVVALVHECPCLNPVNDRRRVLPVSGGLERGTVHLFVLLESVCSGFGGARTRLLRLSCLSADADHPHEEPDCRPDAIACEGGDAHHGSL